MTIAAVTGLAAEARIAERNGILARATGGDARRTAEACADFLAAGAALVSFGIAGALAPGLAPGTLLVPRRVVSDAAVIAVDDAWQRRLAQALGRANEDDLFGAAAMIAMPAAKAALHRRTGAVAVDLESHIVAAAARRANKPFVVVRAVADSAAFALPPAVAVGLDAAGRAALGPVLRAVLRQPGQVPALACLAWHTRAALGALARAAAVLSSLGDGG
jgi:adenosylhomocysteine nucleosidase